MSRMTVVSIQVGLPRELGSDAASEPFDRAWETGFFKDPVAGPLHLGRTNLAGDRQADSVYHGGPDKAVCVYSADHYDAWRSELGLDPFPFGSFGENFTVSGQDETSVCVGDVWQAGHVLVQVSQPRQPCWKLARRWRIKNLPALVLASGRTGWYFRVLTEGDVSAGQAWTLTHRPHPEWSLDRANHVMHGARKDHASAIALAALPALSASWRNALAVRIEKADSESAL